MRRALDAYVRDVVERHPEVDEVVLFGSLVRGTPVPGSDVDLLIVVRHSDRPFLDRIALFLPTNFPVAADVFVYTRQELARMVAEGNGLVRTALREGIYLFRRSSGD